MSDKNYSRSVMLVDDRQLTPTQAARILKLIPEALRWPFLNSIPEATADQATALREVVPVYSSRPAEGSTARHGSGGRPDSGTTEPGGAL